MPEVWAGLDCHGRQRACCHTTLLFYCPKSKEHALHSSLQSGLTLHYGTTYSRPEVTQVHFRGMGILATLVECSTMPAGSAQSTALFKRSASLFIFFSTLGTITTQSPVFI